MMPSFSRIWNGKGEYDQIMAGNELRLLFVKRGIFDKEGRRKEIWSEGIVGGSMSY